MTTDEEHKLLHEKWVLQSELEQCRKDCAIINGRFYIALAVIGYLGAHLLAEYLK
jgi:hypothetical protein